MLYDEGEPSWIGQKCAIERELRINNHSNVTRCFGGFFVTRNEYMLVLERMQYSLQNVIGALSVVVFKKP